VPVELIMLTVNSYVQTSFVPLTLRNGAVPNVTPLDVVNVERSSSPAVTVLPFVLAWSKVRSIGCEPSVAPPQRRTRIGILGRRAERTARGREAAAGGIRERDGTGGSRSDACEVGVGDGRGAGRARALGHLSRRTTDARARAAGNIEDEG